MKATSFRTITLLTYCLIAFNFQNPLSATEPAAWEDRLLEALEARAIGPANMSGRVTAVAVSPHRRSTFYVGSAAGGLWKTTNNGTTWTPVFDQLSFGSIGDVAIAPSQPNVVWVGAGESNARNSVSWGKGVYQSRDGGKTWSFRGLGDTRHIGRIAVHPTDPDTVYVAALGHLWGPNKERGLFKTTNGGKTWENVLPLDEDTGCVDVVLDPSSPHTVYAAAYQVRRDRFSGGNPAIQFGAKAGLYKSVDAGKSWEKLTMGLPGCKIGRCAIAISRQNPQVLYALIPTEKTAQIRELEFGQPQKPSELTETGGLFRSENGGISWQKRNDLCPRPFYFGQIRVDPANDQRVYVLGVTLHVSVDGGQQFKSLGEEGVHADIHALWIDPEDPDHWIAGSDGGLHLSYDQGRNWETLKNLPIGQFYGIALDEGRPYRVYGGLQDNGTWCGPTATRNAEGITLADWTKIMGADGFRCRVDPFDPQTVYAEGQYGMFRRINPRLGTEIDIRPRPPQGSPDYRFNWNAPLIASSHEKKAVYYGGNHVFCSVDRGDTWKAISPDLTRGKPGPDKSMGHTLTALAESPVKEGLLYAGSDDGKLFVSRDGGGAWTDLSDHLPGIGPDRWITCIECSHYAEGTALVAVDRHREDDNRPYLFKTKDYGATWQLLNRGLPPDGPLHVVREDCRNPALIFAGTEFGLYISLNGGERWHPLRSLPAVPVQDLAIQSRDRELVIATHGRSLYVMDIAPLESWTPASEQAGAFLFDLKPAELFESRGYHALAGSKTYTAPNPRIGATIQYFLKEKCPTPVYITISDSRGNKIAHLEASDQAGFHRVSWNLKVGKDSGRARVRPGEYLVTLEAGTWVMAKKLHVEAEE